jgi:acyl carrier protein|tara:strand:- start:584 stop:808 length:225 start_codon:yes stop_codon:yes gene_type:complete
MTINKKKIIEIVSRHTKVPFNKIDGNSSTENIETWDSLAQLRIILELENITNVKVPTSSYGNYNSIEKISKKFL